MGVVFNHLPAVNALDTAYWVTVFLLSAPVHCIHCRGAVWGQLDLPYSGLGTRCQQAAALQLWPSPGKASGMKVPLLLTLRMTAGPARGPGHRALCSPGLAHSSECYCSSYTALPGTGTSNSMSKEAGAEKSLCWMLLPAGRRACSCT